MKRAQPLVDVEGQQREAEADFNQKWDAGEFEDWRENQPSEMNGSGEGIWCAACAFTSIFSFHSHRPDNSFQVKKCTPSRLFMMHI